MLDADRLSLLELIDRWYELEMRDQDGDHAPDTVQARRDLELRLERLRGGVRGVTFSLRPAACTFLLGMVDGTP